MCKWRTVTEKNKEMNKCKEFTIEREYKIKAHRARNIKVKKEFIIEVELVISLKWIVKSKCTK